MHILAFVNQKGGTGKSKTVLGTAPELAAIGRKVLVIDSDPQATTTNAMLGRGHDIPGLAEVLGSGNVAEEARPKTRSVIVPVETWGVDLLASNFHRLALAETEHTNDSSRVVDLNYALESLAASYDYVLIDTPGNLGPLVMGAIMAATQIIVIIDSGTESLEGFATLQGALKRAARLSSFDVLGVVSTRFKAQTDLSRTVFASVKEATSYPLYATIREATKIGAMNEQRLPIGKIAPGKPEHQDFVKLAKAIDMLLAGTSRAVAKEELAYERIGV